MKNTMKLAGGRAAAAGAILVALGLTLRQFQSGVPNCIISIALAAGMIILIFALGRADRDTQEPARARRS